MRTLNQSNMRKILITLIMLIQIPLAKAYVECTSSPATDTALANLTSSNPPEITINEVSFKDKTADFMELYVKDDKNSGLGANMKDFAILADGSEIKKIATDIILKTGEFILIHSNLPQPTKSVRQIIY